MDQSGSRKSFRLTMYCLELILLILFLRRIVFNIIARGIQITTRANYSYFKRKYEQRFLRK